MNILENFEPKELNPDSPDGAVILALSFWRALRDRDRTPSDPDLFPQLKKKPMLRERYAQRVAQQIRMVSNRNRTQPDGAAKNQGETTHLSVVDGRGNAVAITQSIELIFGSKRTARDLGFFYNNYMSTFNYRDMIHPHYLLPGASPASSVAPTMILKKNAPFLVLGSPGSERITTAIALVISRMIDGKESLEGAVWGPRLHTTREGHVHIELSRFAPEVREALAGSNLMVVKKGSYSFYLGAVQAVQYPARQGNPYKGVADPRRNGTAKGPDRIQTGG
jgi:gamma-glutamyltranspeptidase/glutathione hydrolase